MKSLIVWLKLNFGERLCNSLNAAVTQSEKHSFVFVQTYEKQNKVSLNYMSIETSVQKMWIKSI